MEGAVGNPVISKFNGGEDLDTYSDYMRVNLVTAPEGYTAGE